MSLGKAVSLPPPAIALDFPELSEIDAPPRATRFVALGAMALTVVASIGTMVSVRSELSYFAGANSAVELGEATQLDPTAGVV